ncbi:MAG TPA: hypothetical protein DEP23_05235 [Ruminococcaceae bacterium]|nr:hypothetical protein [Oscillospiraceae bacterium]
MKRTYIFALASKDETTYSVSMEGNPLTQLNMLFTITEDLLPVFSKEKIKMIYDQAVKEYEDKHH